MDSKFEKKLAGLPISPGVYYHFDKHKRIIYVGKAKSLRQRVRHYFQPATKETGSDKTKALLKEIASFDCMVVGSELEALVLEAELIKRYQPKYNILEKDRSMTAWCYVGLALKSPLLTVSLKRRPDPDDQLTYCGPYLGAAAIKQALKYLRRIFPYSTHQTKPKKACLDYHIGLCPGPETADFDYQRALADLKNLRACLSGKQTKVVRQLKEQMDRAAKDLNYELAALRRNQIQALKELKSKTIFSNEEYPDVSKDYALANLTALFNLEDLPGRIDCFDISHISGSHNVASMIVCQNGLLDPAQFRRYRLKIAGNNDFAHIKEAVTKRLTGCARSGLPDMIIVDGGKSQVRAASQATAQLGLQIPILGLAKREEQIIFLKSNLELNQGHLIKLQGKLSDSDNFGVVQLPLNSPLIHFLQRLRDASHRLAVSYHHRLRRKSQLESQLVNIPSVGPQSYRKLIKHFGSHSKLKRASLSDLTAVVGAKRAEAVYNYLKT